MRGIGGAPGEYKTAVKVWAAYSILSHDVPLRFWSGVDDGVKSVFPLN